MGGPKRGGGTPDRRPQPDGGPLAPGAEGGKEQPEGGGEHERAAGRLQHVGGDEEAERRGDGAQRGRGGEDGQTDEEGLLAPGAVGPAAGGHQRGGEDDRVGAQHPRQRAQALAVEAGRDAREGDVDDEEVEGGQEDPRQDDQGGQGRVRSTKSCHKMHCNEESCMKQRMGRKYAVSWEDAQAGLPQPVLPGGVDPRGRGRAVDAPDHPRTSSWASGASTTSSATWAWRATSSRRGWSGSSRRGSW